MHAGRVVAEADAAVVEEAGEGRPARQHVVDRLGGLGIARQPGAVGAIPVLRSATAGKKSCRCRAAKRSLVEVLPQFEIPAAALAGQGEREGLRESARLRGAGLVTTRQGLRRRPDAEGNLCSNGEKSNDSSRANFGCIDPL